jgi:diacylglycerol kinase (ATP)
MVSGEPRENRGWLARRLGSFAHAFRGVGRLLREPNARVHLVATLVVVWAAAFLHVAPLEWAALVFAIVLVFVAEAFNTALESLADATVPERHPLVGTAKDVAAAGVLLAALGAVLIGGLVFVPHFVDLSRKLR